MATYNYKCKSCSHTVTVQHSMLEDFRTTCPSCKSESLNVVIGVANFTLKGEGWASKDIRLSSMARSS